MISKALQVRSVSKLLGLFLLLTTACEQPTANQQQTAQIAGIPDNLPEVDKRELTLVSELGVVKQGQDLFSGLAVVHYHNGQLAERTTYVKGKKHGPSQKWFENGTMSYSVTNNSNRLHGKVRSWWSNGNLRSESTMIDGVMHGVYRQWYRSGALLKEMNIDHGKEKGLQRAWRENGKIFNNYEARNGRIFGLKRSELCFELDDETIPTGN